MTRDEGIVEWVMMMISDKISWAVLVFLLFVLIIVQAIATIAQFNG